MNAILKSKAKFKSVLIMLLLCPTISFSQSDVINVIRGGEILIGGLMTIFSSKSGNNDSFIVESVCVKNKMEDKITFIISRQTEEGEEFCKELIIQKDSKECFYDLPKGIYTYQVILSNEEIFKKGEYKFNDKTVIAINE